MKFGNVFCFAALLALVTALFLGSTRHSFAAERTITGSIALETPVGMSPDRAAEDSPTVLGYLKLNNLFGPVGLFGGGKVQTRKGFPWDSENRAYVGLEAPVGNDGLTVYGYAERRFNVNANRFMVGARYNFKTGY
jgi:hypothetical protein